MSSTADLNQNTGAVSFETFESKMNLPKMSRVDGLKASTTHEELRRRERFVFQWNWSGVEVFNLDFVHGPFAFNPCEAEKVCKNNYKIW